MWSQNVRWVCAHGECVKMLEMKSGVKNGNGLDIYRTLESIHYVLDKTLFEMKIKSHIFILISF